MTMLARRLVATDDWEDVAQDALSEAWRRRAIFDADRGTPRNWLLALVVTHARRHRSRSRETPVASVPDSPVIPTDGHAVDMAAALGTLPRRQHEAVALYYYLDLPVAAVAQVMSCSEGTVKSTLADARRSLRTTLGESYR
ncbi:RNA polymerase sigma factor [Nakamurella alba]|nr:RNA polymerase sigma factor [Nakamurella alba]